MILQGRDSVKGCTRLVHMGRRVWLEVMGGQILGVAASAGQRLSNFHDGLFLAATEHGRTVSFPTPDALSFGHRAATTAFDSVSRHSPPPRPFHALHVKKRSHIHAEPVETRKANDHNVRKVQRANTTDEPPTTGQPQPASSSSEVQPTASLARAS